MGVLLAGWACLVVLRVGLVFIYVILFYVNLICLYYMYCDTGVVDYCVNCYLCIRLIVCSWVCACVASMLRFGYCGLWLDVCCLLVVVMVVSIIGDLVFCGLCYLPCRWYYVVALCFEIAVVLALDISFYGLVRVLVACLIWWCLLASFCSLIFGCVMLIDYGMVLLMCSLFIRLFG